MARKDKFKREDSSSAVWETVNVDFRVGRGGENKQDDVMLIQTLFKYISSDTNHSKKHLGTIVPPKVDGICGPKTLKAISEFQKIHASRLIRVDGVIHPASYGGRIIKDISKPLMTITLLHEFAWNAGLWLPDGYYVDGLLRIEPRLRSTLTYKIDI